MAWYYWILLPVYIGICVFLILVILLQAGKGGGLSSLGSGSGMSDSLGATSAEKTLARWTTYCAIGFGVLAIALTLLGSRTIQQKTILDKIEETAPAPLESTMPPASVPAAKAAVPAEASVPVKAPQGAAKAEPLKTSPAAPKASPKGVVASPAPTHAAAPVTAPSR